MSALLTHILGVGDDPENFDILQVGGPKDFAILWMCGFIRPPPNSVWQKFYGWVVQKMFAILGVGGPKKRLQTPPPLTFLME